MSDKGDLRHLVQHVFNLRTQWECYECLYRHTDDRGEILYAHTSVLFEQIRISLLKSMVMAACQLTDQTKTMGKFDNLVIGRFATPSAVKSERLKILMKKLKAKSKLLKVYRDKLVAHLDLETARDPTITRSPLILTIKHVVLLLQEAVGIVELETTGTRYPFRNIKVDHEVDWLEACLILGDADKRKVLEQKMAVRSKGTHRL